MLDAFLRTHFWILGHCFGGFGFPIESNIVAKSNNTMEFYFLHVRYQIFNSPSGLESVGVRRKWPAYPASIGSLLLEYHMILSIGKRSWSTTPLRCIEMMKRNSPFFSSKVQLDHP